MKKELYEKYFDASLSKSEMAEFREELKKDDSLLREFLEDAHLENALSSFFEEEEGKKTINFPEDIYDGEISEDDLKNINAAGIFTPPSESE